eukprot:6061200-Ditylum_brightwellii.AAC.1
MLKTNHVVSSCFAFMTCNFSDTCANTDKQKHTRFFRGLKKNEKKILTKEPKSSSPAEIIESALPDTIVSAVPLTTSDGSDSVWDDDTMNRSLIDLHASTSIASSMLSTGGKGIEVRGEISTQSRVGKDDRDTTVGEEHKSDDDSGDFMVDISLNNGNGVQRNPDERSGTETKEVFTPRTNFPNAQSERRDNPKHSSSTMDFVDENVSQWQSSLGPRSVSFTDVF